MSKTDYGGEGPGLKIVQKVITKYANDSLFLESWNFQHVNTGLGTIQASVENAAMLRLSFLGISP